MRNLVLLLAALAIASAFVPWPRPLVAPRDGSSRFTAADIKAWGLQLQDVLPLAVPRQVDVMVVDYAHDGEEGKSWTRARVDALRRRDGAPPRTVLAYLSIGEAESYRHYWSKSWQTNPPAWLGAENPSWKGNYAVRYWLPEWQSFIVSPDQTVLTRILDRLTLHRKPFIDRIIDAGFDGVYLDRVDAFDTWEKERGTAAAQGDMAAFVRRIADYARSRRPGFLVVPQNGEELIELPGYTDLIDGFAKEDVLYGAVSEGTANEATVVDHTTGLLDRVKAKGKPVLVVEYLSADDPRAAEVARIIAARGYVPLIAARALDKPPELPATLPHPDAGATAARATDQPANTTRSGAEPRQGARQTAPPTAARPK